MKKLLSWNVNGIRANIKKGGMDSVVDINPDVICLQETKATPDQVELNLPDYPHQFWNSAEKKGYSGTAIFSKTKPLHVDYGIGIEKHDNEGRVITASYENFYLVNVYVPNSKRGLLRLDYRCNEWEVDFLSYLKELESTNPVVLCGDLNVAHTKIDLKNPQSNKTTASNPGNAGFTDQERKSFENMLDAGFIDSFREFNKEGGNYTWWSYMFNARANNAGWRIDYFMVSQILRSNLKGADILPDIMGSDHCPVTLDIEI